MKYWVIAVIGFVVSAFDDCQDAPQLFSTGSSHMFAMAEMYSRVQNKIDVVSTVTSCGSIQGSTLGFKNLLSGVADIALVSRLLIPKDYRDLNCDSTLINDDGTIDGSCLGVLPKCINIAQCNAQPSYMYFDNSSNGDIFTQSLIRKYICGILSDVGQQIMRGNGCLPLSPEEVALQSFDLNCDVANAQDFEKYTGGSFQDCKDSMTSVVITGSSIVQPIIGNSQKTCGNAFVNIFARPSSSSIGIATFLAGGSDFAATTRVLRGDDYAYFGCKAEDVDSQGNVKDLCRGKEPKSVKIGRDELGPLYIMYDAQSTFNEYLLIDEAASEQLCCFLSEDGQQLVANAGYNRLTQDEIENEIIKNNLVCDNTMFSYWLPIIQ